MPLSEIAGITLASLMADCFPMTASHAVFYSSDNNKDDSGKGKPLDVIRQTFRFFDFAGIVHIWTVAVEAEAIVFTC